MLKGEDFLKILVSLQMEVSYYGNRLILPDGTYETSTKSFFDKYKKR